MKANGTTTTPGAANAAGSTGSSPAGSSVGTRKVRFRIKRCEGPGKLARWETFELSIPRGENVISCLQRIAAHPVTTDGNRSTPVVWDCSCLEEVCGACTMVINGKARQSCSALLDVIAPNDGDTITLEPMSKFPVIRDLWVDRSRMFDSLKRIKAWVPIDGLYDQGAGPRERPDDQAVRYTLSECMTCGCCLEACPQFLLVEDESAWSQSFIGAQAISQARLFNLHETGAQLKGDRLDTLMGPGGVSDCGNAQNCVKVCPKHIPLTESIASIGRSATTHAISNWFAGR